MEAAVVSENASAVIWFPQCRRSPRAPLSDPTSSKGSDDLLDPDAAEFRCIPYAYCYLR